MYVRVCVRVCACVRTSERVCVCVREIVVCVCVFLMSSKQTVIISLTSITILFFVTQPQYACCEL